jgi:hypothetical protein
MMINGQPTEVRNFTGTADIQITSPDNYSSHQ